MAKKQRSAKKTLHKRRTRSTRFRPTEWHLAALAVVCAVIAALITMFWPDIEDLFGTLRVRAARTTPAATAFGAGMGNMSQQTNKPSPFAGCADKHRPGDPPADDGGAKAPAGVPLGKGLAYATSNGQSIDAKLAGDIARITPHAGGDGNVIKPGEMTKQFNSTVTLEQIRNSTRDNQDRLRNPVVEQRSIYETDPRDHFMNRGPLPVDPSLMHTLNCGVSQHYVRAANRAMQRSARQPPAAPAPAAPAPAAPAPAAPAPPAPPPAVK